MWEQLALSGASGFGKGLAGMFGGGSKTSSAASTLINEQTFNMGDWSVATSGSKAGAGLSGAEWAALAFAGLLVFRYLRRKNKGA